MTDTRGYCSFRIRPGDSQSAVYGSQFAAGLWPTAPLPQWAQETPWTEQQVEVDLKPADSKEIVNLCV
jgi:hypothetical protein